ncbi:E3 ubiquitin-protein ligase RNF212B [Formica fusca]
MDSLICNKCFVPIRRGHQPYNITQCGHIFCQDCLQQVERQCSQCEYISPAYLSLKEPVMPKTISFFAPVTEIWEMLLKADMLRSNQIKITMQRFRELDEKYEKLKNQFFIDQRNFKILREKYMNLKKEKENVQKKILQIQNMYKMQNVPRPMKTTTDFYPSTHSSSARCASGSLDFLKFSNVTPMSVRSIDLKKHQTDADGFRVPRPSNPRRGNPFIFTSDTGSNYSFK